ncbi:MAG: ATP-binding protein [Anaerolineaceae bacterium]
MNDYPSPHELYYNRWITPLLINALKEASVLVLTGARQVGKSTLLRMEAPFKDFAFYALDDFDILRQATEDPTSLWAERENIIIDEVQKAPNLLPFIKQTVDQNPGKYHFVLSGSANLLLMKQVSESLAGRAIYFELDPLTLGEIHQNPLPKLLTQMLTRQEPELERVSDPILDLTPTLLRGLMPSLLRLTTSDSWSRWWEGYVATYLERDLRQISQIVSLLDFRQMMELLALRSANVLNQSDLARDAGLSQSTTHRYLNLLETTYLFYRLPVYLANRSTRLIKSPKAVWNDTGLICFLCGYYHEDELRNARELGQIFESFIYHHLRVTAEMMTPKARVYYWRTVSGEEVDFIFEYGRKCLAIEVKLTQKPGYDDAKGLRSFLDKHPEAAGALLITCGQEVRRFGANILAVPWNLITG